MNVLACAGATAIGATKCAKLRARMTAPSQSFGARRAERWSCCFVLMSAGKCEGRTKSPPRRKHSGFPVFRGRAVIALPEFDRPGWSETSQLSGRGLGSARLEARAPRGLYPRVNGSPAAGKRRDVSAGISVRQDFATGKGSVHLEVSAGQGGGCGIRERA